MCEFPWGWFPVSMLVLAWLNVGAAWANIRFARRNAENARANTEIARRLLTPQGAPVPAATRDALPSRPSSAHPGHGA